MKKADAVLHFGSQSKLAKALGLTKSAVSQWDEHVPALRAYQIQSLTNGNLVAVGLPQESPSKSAP